MSSDQSISQLIDDALGNSKPGVATICHSILKYIQENHQRRLHLTYGLLRRETGASTSTDLWQAITFLTGDRAHVLETNFEFVDEENEYHHLLKSDVAQARQKGVFYHPVTGEKVDRFEESILAYFTPTAYVLERAARGGEL